MAVLKVNHLTGLSREGTHCKNRGRHRGLPISRLKTEPELRCRAAINGQKWDATRLSPASNLAIAVETLTGSRSGWCLMRRSVETPFPRSASAPAPQSLLATSPTLWAEVAAGAKAGYCSLQDSPQPS
jgi:hypothetical protein